MFKLIGAVLDFFTSDLDEFWSQVVKMVIGISFIAILVNLLGG